MADYMSKVSNDKHKKPARNQSRLLQDGQAEVLSFGSFIFEGPRVPFFPEHPAGQHDERIKDLPAAPRHFASSPGPPAEQIKKTWVHLPAHPTNAISEQRIARLAWSKY